MRCILCTVRKDVDDNIIGADFVAATFYVEGMYSGRLQTVCPAHVKMLERVKAQALDARGRHDVGTYFQEPTK